MKNSSALMRYTIGIVSENFWSSTYKVWTVLHNFDCRAPDGTTPASRFFRRAFPDLFETVLSHVEDLARPRQRNQSMALSS